MNSIIQKLAFCVLLGASGSAIASPVLMPNGDFSAGATSWHQVGPITGFSYPTSGGNSDGYGVMDATNGQWGIWVGNADSAISLSSLGLSAGQTYTFSQDMKVISGASVGGFKIDFVPSGSTGDKRIAKIGDGSTWETYDYSVAIPAGTTGIKIVPLWGPNSVVGFDNFRVENGAVPPPPVIPGIPNPGFEIAGGASWAAVGPITSFTYPSTGGNPGGYGIMNASNGQWGIWVSNSDSHLTLEQLSLTAGQTYNFTVDMKIESGANVGGLKVDFSPSGSTGDMRIAKIGTGSAWATYTYSVAIPAGTTGLKIVPLWGANSSVGYDNFTVSSPPAPLPPQATIASATQVTWSPLSTVNSYQAQKSADGVIYTDLGAPIVGNAVSSTFETGKAAFYRVMESTPGTQEAVFNGGFEDEGFDEFEADGWLGDQSQPAERYTAEVRTGTACMQLKVLNAAVEPNGSELSQNVTNSGGSITTGSSYTLSFWYKQISSGPSYVQEYRVSWLAEGGAEVQAGVWQNLPSNSLGPWTQRTLSGLVAPAGAVTAFIQIVGKTGAVEGGFGEILIDDVSLSASGFSTPTLIASSTAPAVAISWPSTTGKSTRVQSSYDLSNWSNFSDVIVGDNTTKVVYDTMVDAKKFYKVGELP
jgi:hypothetical protein